MNQNTGYVEECTLKGHVGPVLVVRFNRDGQYCLSGGKDRSIMLWNPHRGTRIKTYDRLHGYEVLDIRVVSDNSKFVTCGGDGKNIFWDVATGKSIRRFRAHTGRVNTIRLNQDDSVLISGGYDKTIKCFDLRSNLRDPIETMTGFSDSVSAVVLAAHHIIGAGADGKMKIFDLRMAQVITDHIGKPITSMSLSNGGNCILLGCLDSTMRMFDRQTGELLNEYTGHMNKNYKVECCLTNDDAAVASGSEDNCIYFWDLVNADRKSVV